MTYTFKRFSNVQGWWLVIEPNDKDMNEKFKNFPEYTESFGKKYLDAGQAICINRLGGYHPVTEDHRVVALQDSASCTFPNNFAQ